MNVVVCYDRVNGYIASCCRALAARDNVEVFVVGLSPNAANYPTGYAHDVMQGLSHRLLTMREVDDERLVTELVTAHRPDAILLSGWQRKSYRLLLTGNALPNARSIMLMDNPYKGSIRQWIGGHVLRGYLARMDFIFVPGERSWQLAKRWRVPEARIRRGCYSVDTVALEGAMNLRSEATSSWPRSFLFAGRYVYAKAIDVLVAAYKRYRASMSNPWPLRCCGVGECGSALSGVAGIEDLGFVQPADIPSVLSQAGVFVLPSRFDAWGVVILEACASGLPVVCSEACGSSVELVRSFYNGLVCPTGDVDALASAMRWCHEHHAQLPEMGRRSQELARPYSAQMWADRVMAMLTSAPMTL